MAIANILDDESSFGLIRYFESSRCWNKDTIHKFNKGRISAKELVTFDCAMMEMDEILATIKIYWKNFMPESRNISQWNPPAVF